MSQFDFMRMALMPKMRPDSFGQSATMQDEPEQGVVSIGGTGGGVIDLNLSEAHSMDRQRHEEASRVYDVMRSYNTRSDRSVDKTSYVDWEALRRVDFSSGDSATYAAPQTGENVDLISSGRTRTNT